MNMLKTLCITLAGTALMVAQAKAQLPVRSGERNLFGMAYDFGWRGELITDAKTRAHLLTHRGTYAWAPWEYLEMSVGLGASRYATYGETPADFEGNWKFTPSAGIVLNTPAIGDILRLRAACDYAWWQSEDAGITYSEHVVDPAVSLVWNTRHLDIELGALTHVGLGTMKATAKESDFGNYYTGRGFAAITLLFPGRTFLRLYGDASPKADGWHGGPTESTLGITFGWLARRHKVEAEEPELRHFPSVPGLREKQGQMEEELRAN